MAPTSAPGKPAFLSQQKRSLTQDRDAPHGGKDKSARIDLGLTLLSIAAKPGVKYTYDEIAAWAGCTHTSIKNIEKRALRKLSGSPILREFFEATA